MNFKVISKSQNQPGSLRMLLAQRKLNSKAKNWVKGQIGVLVFLPMLAAGCARLKGCPDGLTALVALLALALDVVLIDRQFKKKNNLAVNIQEQFDCQVLGLEWPTWKLGAKVDVTRHCHVSPQELSVEAKREKLPDWYAEPKSINAPAKIVLACQKQNLVYSEELKGEIFETMFTGLILVLLAEILAWYFFKLPLPDLMGGSFVAITSPFVIWFVRELFRVHQYQKRLFHLQGVVGQLLDGKVDERHLRNIQDEIIELRKSAPVVYDFHYWWRRDKIEKMISLTSKHRA